MTRSNAAVAFAREVISQHGHTLSGVEGQVRVPLTQHELARRFSCSPSTIAWYLRQLGPAVTSRRGGLTFDCAALAGVGTAHTGLAPRTAAVERALVDGFARPTADGTRVELAASLADLACHLGINRSSAHRHVTALERAGRVVRNGRRLYLVDDDTKEPAVHDQAPPRASKAPGVDISPGQLIELLDKVADVMGSVADIARQLLASSVGAGEPAESRFVGAQTVDSTHLRAAEVADGVRGSSSDKDLIDQSCVEITSTQSELRAAESRIRTQVRAATPRTQGPHWHADDLPALLAPLLEECDRQGLPGVTDPQRVLASLAVYDAGQVRLAAKRMAADLRSGAPMRSPIAILIRKADDADPYYFRAPAAPRPASPPPVVEHTEAHDDEAAAGVALLAPDELARLDEAVAERLRSLLGQRSAAAALASPETFEHWRPIVWRAQRERKEQS